MMTDTRSANYAKGLLTGFASALAFVAVGLWLKPFTLRFLDGEEFAVFTLAGDLLILLTFLDLGQTTSLRAQAARLLARSEAEVHELSDDYVFVQSISAALILLLGVVISFFAPDLLGVRDDLRPATMLTMFVLSFTTALNFAGRPFASLLFVRQRAQVSNAIQLASLALRVVLAVTLLWLGWKLMGLAIAALAAATLNLCLLIVGSRRALPRWRFSFRNSSLRRWWNRAGGLSLWFGLVNLAGLAIQSLDRIVAAYAVAVAATTTLILTGQVYVIANILVSQVTLTGMPVLGNLIGANDERVTFSAFRQLFTVSMGAAIMLVASLWAGNGAFVVAWVGAANYGGWKLDLWLALALIAATWSLPFRGMLSASLNARSQARVRVPEAALNLILSVVFALRFGLVGVAMGSVAAALVTSCWQLPLLVAQYFQRPTAEMLRLLCAPLVTTAFATVAVAVACAARLFVASRGGFVSAMAAMALVGTTGALTLWLFAFDAELRARIKSTLSALRRGYFRRSANAAPDSMP